MARSEVLVFQTEEQKISHWAKKPSVIAMLCRRIRRLNYNDQPVRKV